MVVGLIKQLGNFRLKYGLVMRKTRLMMADIINKLEVWFGFHAIPCRGVIVIS